MSYKSVKFVLLLFLCLLTWSVNANQNANGSKASIIVNDDVLKKHLKKILFFDSINEPDSLRRYVDLGIILCDRIELTNETPNETQATVAEIYNFYGSNYYMSNDLAEALIGFQKASELYKKVDIKNKLAQCLNNMAIIYLKIGNQTKSLDCLHKSTSIFIDINDSNSIALGYNSIAKIYRDQNDFQRTQEYLDKALIIGRKLGNPDVLSSILNSIAGLKKELGDQAGALALYNEALSIAKEARSEMKSALILNNLGVIHKDLGDLEIAKTFFESAYKIALDNNSDYGKVFTLVNLGDYYRLTNKYDRAFELTNKALEISENTANDEGKHKAILILIKIFEEQKLWEKTAYYQAILIKHKNKIEQQIIEQISQQETIRYKLEKERYIAQNKEDKAKLNREKEIQRLNFLYIIFSVLFVMLLTFSLIVYFRLRSSREMNKDITKQSEERKLLLQEVHHRVKNNFQIVSSMLRLQSYNFDNEILRENFEEAVNRINAMAIVHDVIYRQEKFSDIDAKTYLEKLVKNLHRTGDSRIIISIESEEVPFKIETLINLGIALNELITNSFKHAFNDQMEQPEIKISLSTIGEKTYEIIYKDNGVGINRESYASSFGMELIETIISNFEGEVELMDDQLWKTWIRITFKEF